MTFLEWALLALILALAITRVKVTVIKPIYISLENSPVSVQVGLGDINDLSGTEKDR